jgi:hypothetical protein
MQRRPWFEFHDHPRFPHRLRDLVTGALEAIWNALDSYRPVAPLLARAMHAAGTYRVVDLCSGGGGPWPRLGPRLLPLLRAVPLGDGSALPFRDGSPVDIPAPADIVPAAPAVLLTDKYPNHEAFARIGGESGHEIEGCLRSVDATHIRPDLTGFRTMFTAFHHVPPEQAHAILADAFKQRQGIAIFELPRRDLRTMASVFAVPLLALWLTPRMRPFHWRRIFWTYCLPVIPFTVWIDGILSCLRAYSPQDLRELTSDLNADDYRWELSEVKNGVMQITVLLGYPVKNALTMGSVPSLRRA